MKKCTLSQEAWDDLFRWLAYGWTSWRIARLLNRLYGLDLTHQDIEHVRVEMYGRNFSVL